ncbi:unnamed protein product [Caenorhabditis bovis]|uniref:Uncharacterized protein n=1 Tax=Caenorhabditis bovis TaxID=2654633 RepID=A0A8S1ES47_9PELO|nr:unnamed protein product [Caenorhabditis bovis]
MKFRNNEFRVRSFSIRQIALVILVIFVLSSIALYNHAFSEQNQSLRKIENIDDYDAACSGYSYGRIIREQKRILESVRQELGEFQAKLEEIRTIQDEIQRLIPQKQLELSSIEGEIEAAQRQLQELRENRNVRVFLPLSPVFSQNVKTEIVAPSTIVSIEDTIDFRRCSISSFMPVFVDLITFGKMEMEWKNAFESVLLTPVKDANSSCITIKITNGKHTINENTIENTVIFNVGTSINATNSRVIFAQSSNLRPNVDFAISTDQPLFNVPSILPYSRSIFFTLIIEERAVNEDDLQKIRESARRSNDVIRIIECTDESDACEESSSIRDEIFKSTMFCFLMPSRSFTSRFLAALRTGCVPFVISSTAILPFQDFIDWRLASYQIASARLSEAHFIARSFTINDILEMRRKGIYYYENYLSTKQKIARTLLSALRYKLQLPTPDNRKFTASPLFNASFTAPKGFSVNQQPNYDDDFLLGPLESRVESPSYEHNFTEFQLYSYETWNLVMNPHKSLEFNIRAHEPPAEAEFYPDSSFGFRPIEPGSGVEFSRALGGNRVREQFTTVILTYERDDVLVGALQRLHNLPYLNKVIVIWNNIHRAPSDSWPSLHVPVEFIHVSENSLNNRFIPWDRIETEAVFSIDDDIDLMQQEIILAFRVWRENRDRIVGFPARYHARYGDSMFYNSNHTCQLSIILTGAAFLHKNYLRAYTEDMPKSIREHVDKVTNCEDIAMNYLVAHITRKPPIKTTSRWTLRCPGCTENLSQSDSHFNKRHECMRLFTKIYGYNPLRFSQFRADSILFKTRLPQQHQKCFKYV